MSCSDRLSDRLIGGKFPIQEIVNQWYQSSNQVNHRGNFEIITWKLGTLYIVLLSFRDTTTYRGGDDAEFAIMKFSVTSKSNPNIYVWSRSQVQKENLSHCCNHWEKNDLLTASILPFLSSSSPPLLSLLGCCNCGFRRAPLGLLWVICAQSKPQNVLGLAND